MDNESLEMFVNALKCAIERCCDVINDFVESMRKMLCEAREEAEKQHYKKDYRSGWKTDKVIANKIAKRKYKSYQMRYKSHLDKGKRRFHR